MIHRTMSVPLIICANDSGGGPRGLEDSFVVLAKAAKRQSDPSTEDAPARRIGAGPMAPQQGDDVIAASAYAFKLATTATQARCCLDLWVP